MSYDTLESPGNSDRSSSVGSSQSTASGWNYDVDWSGGEGSDQVAGANAPEFERKVIRNANMVLEAKNGQSATELYDAIIGHCNALGGYEFSSESNHHITHSTVTAVLKVPPEKLDQFMNFVGENARIITSRTDSDDVTDEFYDMVTRLDTKRRTLEGYYTLLENSDGLNEILSLQRTINDIIEEIEAIQGRLRVMNSRIDMATVRLSIRQENDPTPEPRREIDWGALTADDMGYFIKTGFISVINVILMLAQWAVIVVAVTSPVLIPTGIVLFVKRRRKITKATVEENEEENKSE
jgi:hypothetical protein